MTKHTKAGPPARAERGDRPARKSFAGAAPKRSSYGARDGAAPKRAFAPRGPGSAERPRRPYGSQGADAAAPRRSPARGADDFSAPRSAYGDPYQRAQRPPRGDDAADAGRRPAARGFTVTLDPDVARVFRGDASVNKALRLVLQLMQVIEGPAPRGDRPAPRPRSYQGSDEARGFARKPRFVEDDDE